MSVELWPPGKASTSARFALEASVVTAVYLVALAACFFLLPRFDAPQWRVAPFAIVQIAYLLAMVRALLRAHSNLDEMQRRIQHEALVIAVGVVAFGSFGYTCLEVMGLVPALPHELFLVLPSLILVWRVAYIFVERRYS
ncbi:MAG: hypothetical protein ABUS48_06510 [Pseudomonadota bacterium]